MPQKTTSTGQPSTSNPAIIGSDDSSTQAYGRSRSASTEQRGDASPTANVVDHAKATISTVASQAGDKVTAQLDTQRDRAASSLGSVAQALRQSGDATGGLQQYVSSTADQIDRFSGYLRGTNVKQMVGDVEQFARRQPGLFIGGAFLLGILGARFLKSTQEQSSYDSYEPQGGYDTQYAQGGAHQYGSTGGYSAGSSPSYGQRDSGSSGSSSYGQRDYGQSGGSSYGQRDHGQSSGSSYGQGGSGSAGTQSYGQRDYGNSSGDTPSSTTTGTSTGTTGTNSTGPSTGGI